MSELSLYDKHVFDVVPVPPVEAVIYDFLLLTPVQREWVYRHIDYCILANRLDDFKEIDTGNQHKNRIGRYPPYRTNICITAGGTFGDDSRTCCIVIERTVRSALDGRIQAPYGCPRWVTVVPAYAYMGHISVMITDNKIVCDIEDFLVNGDYPSACAIKHGLEKYFNITQRINEFNDFLKMSDEYSRTFHPDEGD